MVPATPAAVIEIIKRTGQLLDNDYLIYAIV